MIKQAKNILLVIALLLIITACSNNQVSYDESDAPKALDNFSQADIIGRMTAIKNGLKPNLKPAKPPADEPASGEPGQPTGRKQLENLAAQYDSAVIKTNFGDITVKFYAQESPITVNSFMNLAKAGFYNGTKFHRVIKDFMIQGGDPNSKDDDWSNDGQGGPGYQFQDEFNQHKLVKGSLAMANSGPNTNGSQFFIVTAAATAWLDGKHTNFGYVANGLDAVEKIQQVKVNQNDHPTEDVVINNIELVKSGEANQAKPVGPELPPGASASSTSTVGQEEKGDYQLK
ncbi:MAG: peptidylprolyl isomerase [bacterium]|nr:peptidylprolyl isomerase [bacterium]